MILSGPSRTLDLGQTHIMDLTCGDVQFTARKNFISLLLCIMFISPTSPFDIEEML